jgi:hypothetical protein
MYKKIICFDLDKVICTNITYKKTNLINYKTSKPIKKSIKVINDLYSRGYKINIFTSRGMTRFKGNLNLINKNLKNLTILQLKKWKLNFHNLYFGKPYYDLFIDDKSLYFKNNWQSNILRVLKKKK